MVNMRATLLKGRAIHNLHERRELYASALEEYDRTEAAGSEDDISLEEAQRQMDYIGTRTEEQARIDELESRYFWEDQESAALTMRNDTDRITALIGESVAYAPMRLSELVRELGRLTTGLQQPATIKVRGEAIQNLINSIGDIDIGAITPRQCAEFFAEKIKTVRPVTHNSLLKELKAAFNKAVDYGFAAVNPFQKIQKVRVPDDGRPKHLTAEQLQSVFDNIPAHLSEYADIITVLVHTGMRLGELVSLQRDAFDAKAGTIIIRHSKNGTARTLPLSDAARTIIAEKCYESTSPYIFHVNGRRRDSKHVSKTIKRFFRAAGLDENLRCHSLRHTAATHMHESGANLLDMSRALGHSTPAITEKYYTHTGVESARRALLRISDLPSSRTSLPHSKVFSISSALT